MIINSHANVFVPENLATPRSQVDESKFIAQGGLSSEALEGGVAGNTSFMAKTPDEAWNEYVTNTSASMIEVSSTIPAGFKNVVARLSDILEENGITPTAGMSINYAIVESEPGFAENERPSFIVEGAPNKETKEKLEKLLNSDEHAGFKDNFLALDALTKSENISIAHKRESLLPHDATGKNTDAIVSYGYEQDFI